MAEGGEVDRLKQRVKELENELASLRGSGNVVSRTKIKKMSAEVVDTNPYR